MIGTGISGLVCANILSDTHDVVVYEKESTSDHRILVVEPVQTSSNTALLLSQINRLVTTPISNFRITNKLFYRIRCTEAIGIGAQGFNLPVGDGTEVTLDVPHRIVNLRYYADLVNFLHMKGLRFEKEVFQMAYSDVEYGSVLQYRQVKFMGQYWPFFPAKPILSNPMRYFHLLYDTMFFYRRARCDLASGKLASLTLGEYLDSLKNVDGYTSVLIESILLPILAIALTTDFDSVRSMPADIPIKYLTSGLFSMRKRDGGMFRPVGGVPQISAVLSSPLKDVRVSTQITQIVTLPNGRISLHDSNGKTEEYDHIVLATQANQAFRLVGHIDPEYGALEEIKHSQTRVVIHSDTVVMGPYFDPRFSFHLLADRQKRQAMASVWMNPAIPQLSFDVHQTTNPIVELDPAKILFQHTFERPLIDMAAAAAIKTIQTQNGKNNIWFCGSYSLYGMPLLENGAQSAFKVAESISGRKITIPPRQEPSTFVQKAVVLSILATTIAASAFTIFKKFSKNPTKSNFDLDALAQSATSIAKETWSAIKTKF